MSFDMPFLILIGVYMFIGHFAIALSIKKNAPKISLGTLILASLWLDLIWPIFLLLGIEKLKIEPGITEVSPLNFIYFPFSHSLSAVIFWALIFGNLFFFFKRELKNSVIISSVILSHWILDFVSHRADLALGFSNSYLVGLGLWNFFLLSIFIELGIFIIGVLFYAKTTKSVNKIGFYSFWILVVLLIFLFFGNIFGPLPPDESTVAYSGLFSWLFVIWCYWIDKNRIIVNH